MRKWLVVFASICLMESSQAWANVCGGEVSVGKEWTTVKGKPFQYNPTGGLSQPGCRFRTDSKVGRRILATCPNGSECAIVVPLGQSSKTIKNITNVERIKLEPGNPYAEGIRDYYDGLCYRARPYLDGPEDKADLWERGFEAARKRDRDRVDRSPCGGARF
jgi:hypothetical protein